MSLFSCLPWFASKAPPAPGPKEVSNNEAVDDPNDRADGAHRETIAVELSRCRKLACRHPDAQLRKDLIALLSCAENRFTQLPPNFGDASRQIEVEEIQAHQLQRAIAPLLNRCVRRLADEEIPLAGRLDALQGVAVVLGGWSIGQQMLDALAVVHDKIPPPDRHHAIRQAVANNDVRGLAKGLDILQQRRPRPNPRELLSQTLRGPGDRGAITLLSHAVAHGNLEVAMVLTRQLATLRRARVIDARDQFNYLRQALQPEVLHRAALSAHAAVSVKVCVDALCMDKGLQSASRQAMPSIMKQMIEATDSPEAFPSLLSQMGQTRQGRVIAARALEDLSRDDLLGRLCRGDAAAAPLEAYLRGLTKAARMVTVSGKTFGRLLLAPGQTGRPAIADARGELRACMRRMLNNIEPQRLLSVEDLKRLRAAVGPA